jgi:hypothetical protein
MDTSLRLEQAGDDLTAHAGGESLPIDRSIGRTIHVATDLAPGSGEDGNVDEARR